MFWDARLEEFRILINSEDPDLIFLSETFWNNNFTVKFKNYSFVKKTEVHAATEALPSYFKKR